MKSRRSKQFRALFAALPKDVQEQAQEAYRLFEADPSYPSLHFKPVDPTGKRLYYSARIGLHYRVIGKMQPDGSILWGWIGTHSDMTSSSLASDACLDSPPFALATIRQRVAGATNN